MAKSDTPKFKLYDATIRLGGSRNNEVLRQGLTAPEVVLLGAIHGEDSVANMRLTKMKDAEGKNRKFVERSMIDERNRLAEIYQGNDARKRGFIARVFGPSTVPLPLAVDSEFKAGEQVDVQQIPQALRDLSGAEEHAAFVG